MRTKNAIFSKTKQSSDQDADGIRFLRNLVHNGIFGDSHVSDVTRIFFKFKMAVWASASGGFRIVSDTLVLCYNIKYTPYKPYDRCE